MAEETETRNADGTLKPGTVLNPNGRNGGAGAGRVSRARRVAQLDAKYDTVEKLMALFEADKDGKLKPGNELLQMHPRDAALIMQSLGAIMGDDKVRERETFLDREEGKPIQRNEFTGKDGGAIEYADAAAARQTLLGREVPSPADTGTDETPEPSDPSPTGKPSV